jgi:ABC-2 type transport system ATP-binding protein
VASILSAVQAAIVVEGLVKRYAGRVALGGVTFDVGSGEIVGLLGPNGAGKSTMLSILATLLVADAGAATVAGHRLPGAAGAVRRAVGLVPQQTAVYPTLTAAENLRFFARMQGLGGAAATAAVQRALALIGLEGRADEPVWRFSGGMRRRLNLACGILHEPRVLLRDEPTVGVDPQSRERIFAAVGELARAGAAILYSTHDMEEAERLARRIVLLDRGQVAAAGTAAALVAAARLTPRLRLRTARVLPEHWLANVDGVRALAGTGTEAVVEVADTAVVPAVLRAAADAGGDVRELALHRPSLADVFFTLTGHALRDDESPAAAAG